MSYKSEKMTLEHKGFNLNILVIITTQGKE